MCDHCANSIRVKQSPIQPDLCAITDSLEAEPVLLPGHTSNRIELAAVPPVLSGQIRDRLKIGSKEYIGVNVVGNETCHDSGWYRDRKPGRNVVTCLRNCRASIGYVICRDK